MIEALILHIWRNDVYFSQITQVCMSLKFKMCLQQEILSTFKTRFYHFYRVVCRQKCTQTISSCPKSCLCLHLLETQSTDCEYLHIGCSLACDLKCKGIIHIGCNMEWGTTYIKDLKHAPKQEHASSIQTFELFKRGLCRIWFVACVQCLSTSLNLEEKNRKQQDFKYGSLYGESQINIHIS